MSVTSGPSSASTRPPAYRPAAEDADQKVDSASTTGAAGEVRASDEGKRKAPAVASETSTDEAPASPRQVPPGSSEARPPTAAEQLLRHQTEAALPGEPDAPARESGLAIDHAQSSVPDPARVPPGQTRDIDGGGQVPLIPLEPQGLVGEVGARERTSDPTTVYVTLNKFESLYEGMVEDGKISNLGEPEVVTLQPGDTVEVFLWNHNKTHEGVAVGMQVVGDHAFDELFENVSLRDLTPPSWRPPLGDGQGARLDDGSGILGVELADEQYGGTVVEMTVRADVPPGTQVGLQHIAVPAGQSGGHTGTLPIDLQTADALHEQHEGAKAAAAGRQPDPVESHQQSTAYGGYEGTLSLVPGRQLVASPGSTAYDGNWLDPKETPPEVLSPLRQATYNVPIHLTVEGEGPMELSLRSFTDWGSDAKSIDAYVIRDGERLPVTPSPIDGDAEQWMALQPGDELVIAFGGSAATAAFLDLREAQ